MSICSCVTRLLIVAGIALLQSVSYAATVDDGDYAYMADGTNIGLLYLQHFEGRDLYAKGQKISGKAKLSGDLAILRGAWFRDWGDYGVVPQFLQPMGEVRTGGDLASVHSTNGMGDLILAVPVHFIKDPTGRDALAFVPWLWLPTGHYDRNNGLNPFAENRWKLTLQLGRLMKVSEAISFELVGDVRLHGDNDDFGPTGARMKQKPLWELQTHVRYFLAPMTYLGGYLSHIGGGETRVDGVAQDDRQSLTKVLLSVGHFVAPDTQVLVSVGKDLTIRTGIKEDARLNFRLLKFF